MTTIAAIWQWLNANKDRIQLTASVFLSGLSIVYIMPPWYHLAVTALIAGGFLTRGHSDMLRGVAAFKDDMKAHRFSPDVQETSRRTLDN